MELIKKLFARPAGPGAGPATESAQFQESETATETSRNAPRRELVHVVLRDSMRRHGIPSAWIECRVLSVVSRKNRSGIHVQLIVRDGADRLLSYVPAFQNSFMDEILRFDARAEEWLFSLSWQFVNLGQSGTQMPDPAVWAGRTAGGQSGIAGASPGAPLFQAPLSPEASTAPVAPPAAEPGPSAADAAAALAAQEDQDVQEDLQALFAIRDAALRPPRQPATGPAGEADFESTHPGAEDPAAAAKPRSSGGW